MKLIDGDALIERMKKDPLFPLVERYGVTGVIEAEPTVDAEPVVRCKDCRWFDKEPGGTYGYCHAAKHAYYSQHWEISIYRTNKDDFYCADGERRGGDDETD